MDRNGRGHPGAEWCARLHLESRRRDGGHQPPPRPPEPVTSVRVCIAEPYRDWRAQIEALPGRLDREGVSLHSGRNLIKRLELAGPDGASIEVAVKAFAVPARARGFVYANLRHSKARRCMINARRLAELGIVTPEPVACIEHQSYRCLRESYYVCRHWPKDRDLTSLLYGGVPPAADARALLEALAQFTVAQHDCGVLHLDYNPGNILVRSEGDGFEFALVDLNRLRFRPLHIGDRARGLAPLTTQKDCLGIIGRRYAGLCGAEPESFCARLEAAQRRFATRRRRVKKALGWLRW